MEETQTKIGTITWFDIPVANIEESKAFYQELFDWEYENFSPAGETYFMAMVKGVPVGALYECKDVNPPNLMPAVMYFTVESIDKTLEKIESIGGKVATDKIEIPQDGGYYAHIQDLDGNLIGIWSKN